MGMTGTDNNPGKSADDSGNGHNPNSGGNGGNGGNGMTGTDGNPGKNADDSKGGYTGGSVGTGSGSGKGTTIGSGSTFPGKDADDMGVGLGSGLGSGGNFKGKNEDDLGIGLHTAPNTSPTTGDMPHASTNPPGTFTGPLSHTFPGKEADDLGVGAPTSTDCGPDGDPDPTQSWFEKNFGWMTGGPFSSSPAVTSPNLGGYPGGYGPQNTSPNAPGGDNGNVNGVGDMPGAGDRYSGNHMPAHDVLKEMQDRITNAWHDHMDPQDDRRPIVLDLDDNGIQITQAQDSHQYVDMTGDGYKHQTAWAGAGDGVLFYDFDGDGQLTQSKEVVFSDWDPGAKSDMQALKDIFDTNHDGKFDSSDAHWADFKVMVTNADGTYSVKTLAELGIKSIDLTENATKIVLPDGSSIDGQTTYTKTDNSVHTVATVTFAVDANGYAVQTSKSVDGSGVTTIDIKTLNHDGTLAGEKIVITSADGLSQTTKTDANGDGVIDKILTDVSSTVSGVKTETLTDTTGAGSLVDRTTIVTSTTAGVKTVATSRDQLGGGWNNQTETFVTNVDTTSTDTVKNVAFDGSTINKTTTAISATGLSRTTSFDIDGNGTNDIVITDVTTVNATTGARTEALSTKAADGAVHEVVTTVTDKTGQSKTITHDLYGNGTVDYQETVVTTKDGSGNTVITDTVSVPSSSTHPVQSKTITTENDTGLWVKTQKDINGDGVIDRTAEDTTVVAGDGTRTETVTLKASDGTLLSSIVTIKHTDGISREIDSDLNGDGHNDIVEVISVDGAGVTSDVTTFYSTNGTKLGSSSRSTTADGLTVTTSLDHTGSGAVDSVLVDQTVKNAGGSSTETISVKSGNGTLLGQKIVDTSVDGLTVKTQNDANGDGIVDNVHLSATTLNGDGSKQIVVTDKSANGTLLDQTTTQISADRKTTTISTDLHGLGKTDRVETIAIQADGSTIDTVKNYAENGVGTGLGTLINSQVTITSGNGLSKTIQTDYDGDGVFDHTNSDVTVYNSDGTIVETKSAQNGSTLTSKSVTTTADDRFSNYTTYDLNGDGNIDIVNHTSQGLSSLDANYDQTYSYDDWITGGSVDQTRSLKSKDGLTTYLGITVGFMAGTHQTVGYSDQLVLNADGSTTETKYVTSDDTIETNAFAYDPTTDFPMSKIVTNISADGKTKTIHHESGSGYLYFTDETIATQANGDVIDTKTWNDSDGAGGGWENSATRVTTSGNGLSVTTERDVDGNGTYDYKKTDVITVAADGTTTEAIELRNEQYNYRISAHVRTTSGDGLTTTDQYDYDGSNNGIYELTRVDASVINSDGSRTETITDYGSNGISLRQNDQQVTTISADRKTVTTSYYDFGKTGVVSTDTTVQAADGSVTDTVIAGAWSASDSFKSTHYVNAAGTTHVDTYYDAAGAVSDKVTETIVHNADGSIVDTSAQSGNLTSNIVATRSGNGFSETVAMTLTGATTYTVAESYATTISGGAVTQTITDKVAGVLKDSSTSTWSNNGLTRTVGLDVNGDGSNDVTDSFNISLYDGSFSDTVTTYNSATKALASTVHYDVGSAGDTWDVSQTLSDGSSSSNTMVFLPSGHVEINGLYSGTANSPAYGQHREAYTGADGYSYLTESETLNAGPAFGHQIETTWTQVSANGNWSRTDIDINGDGLADQNSVTMVYYNSDGSVETNTEADYSNDGSATTAYVTQTIVSHDGKTIINSNDIDGNGIYEEVSTVTKYDDGRTLNATVYYNNKTGAVTTETDVAVSGSGLSTTITSGASGKIVDNLNTFADANGSYQFTRAVSGTKIASVSHNVDANLVDTWSWNISNKTTWATTTSDTVVATSGSVQIDLASEQRAEAVAAAIYGTAYGREMTTDEHEMLAMYISGNTLNTSTLSTNVLASSEFTFRYGTLDNAAFVTQIFKNAFGFVPTADVLGMYTSQLVAATMTKAQVLASIAQSALALGTANDVASLYEGAASAASGSASPNFNVSDGLNNSNASYYFMMSQLGGNDLALTDTEKAALALTASTNPQNTDPNGQDALVQLLIQYGNAPRGIFGEPTVPSTYSTTPTTSTSGTATVTQNNGFVNMAASSKTTLAGNNNIVAQNASSSLTITGQMANMIEVFGTGVATKTSNNSLVIENSAVDTLTGDNNQIMMLASGKVTVTGTGNHLTVAGTADTAIMSNGFGTILKSGALTLTGSSDEFYLGDGAKITATGSNNIIHAVGTATAETVSVSGTANAITVSGAGAAVTMGGGGSNTLDFSAVSTTATMTVTGSANYETITAGAALSSKDTISTGAGVDTLIIDGNHLNSTDFANITGIDVLQVGTLTTIADQIVLADAIVAKSDAKTLTVNAVYTTDPAKISVWGASIDASAVVAADKVIMTGGAFGDILTGGAGNDTLDGGGSQTWQTTRGDLLKGGAGVNVYKVNQNYGFTEIDNSFTSGTAAHGELDFGAGLTSQNLWMKQVGNNLEIDMLGTTDHVTIDGWFGTNASAKLSEIKLSDGSMIDASVSTLVSAMASYQTANPGFDPTTATTMPADSTLQSTITASWHH